MNELTNKQIRMACLFKAVEVLGPNRFRFTAAKEVTGPFLEAAQQFYDFVTAGEDTRMRSSVGMAGPDKRQIMWERAIVSPLLLTLNEAKKYCPIGYRLPSDEELEWLIASTAFSFDKKAKEGIFAFMDGYKLRLPAAGWHSINGILNGQGECGYIWSSSASRVRSETVYHYMSFDNGGPTVFKGAPTDAISALYLPMDVQPN